MTARDYKHAGTRRKPASRQTPCWVWFVVGLSVGLFVAFLVHLRAQGPAWRAPDGPQAAARAPERPAREAARPRQGARPKFDFYTILPEMEVQVPSWRDDPAPPGHGPAFGAGSYVLQAGSFTRLAEADRLKARIALLGIDADIQTVTIDGGATWHRVRIGPVSDPSRIREIRERLGKEGLDLMLLKIKDAAPAAP